MNNNLINQLIKREEIITEAFLIFSDFDKPKHFTNFKHCEECAEHDKLLLSLNRDTLSVNDVGFPGWDPICFINSEGLGYYLPCLIKFALELQKNNDGDPYLLQLLLHLNPGENDKRFIALGIKHVAFIAKLLKYIKLYYLDIIKDRCYNDELEIAIKYWDTLLAD